MSKGLPLITAVLGLLIGMFIASQIFFDDRVLFTPKHEGSTILEESCKTLCMQDLIIHNRPAVLSSYKEVLSDTIGLACECHFRVWTHGPPIHQILDAGACDYMGTKGVEPHTPECVFEGISQGVPVHYVVKKETEIKVPYNVIYPLGAGVHPKQEDYMELTCEEDFS